MRKRTKFNLKARIKSFKYAFNGIRNLFITEHNARIHLFGLIVALCFGFYFQITAFEWLWISLAISLVFITEIVNAAIEKVSDEVTLQDNSGIKLAKDFGAGSALIAAIFALLVAGLVFYKYI